MNRPGSLESSRPLGRLLPIEERIREVLEFNGLGDVDAACVRARMDATAGYSFGPTGSSAWTAWVIEFGHRAHAQGGAA